MRGRWRGRGAVGGAVGDAVDGAVSGAVDGAVGGAVSGAVGDAVRGAVGGAVGDAVRGAVSGAVVDGAVGGAVGDAVDDAVECARSVARSVTRSVARSMARSSGAVGGAVGGAVRGAVGGAVDDAVRGAVGDAVGGAVDGDIQRGVLDAIAKGWRRYIGGQFWAGWGFYWGPAFTSYFREVCDLELKGDLWERGKAYEATVESACWWWPHRRFVMVSERPLAINRELADPSRSRGWGSHRLHHDTGPAVVWPDGWGVWSVHGVRVPRQVVEAPETLTVDQIRGEENAEVRRVMIGRYGPDRYLRESGAQLEHEDECGKLWRSAVPEDEDLVMVEVVNSTPEPNGEAKTYWLRVPPGMVRAREAVAWSFGIPEEEYCPMVET